MATCPTCHTQYADSVETCPTHGDALLPDSVFAQGDSELAPGTIVGEYRIEGKLGEGAFGAVYRAVHPMIGKAAAIKVIGRSLSHDPQMVSRFVAEARAVNQIRHRNIIDIFSFGQLSDGRHYYVMELLVGTTLDKLLAARGRVGLDEAMPILKGIARALGAAHAAGIAHRDLKPENVFVAETDEGAHAKLIDFGIAKLLDDSVPSGHKTRTGAPIGTPYYMSPEQCRGKNVDQRTDIYAFGILIHTVLTGQVPFNGDDVMEVLMKQISATPPRLSEICPDLPAALDEPVLAMLAKDPDKRPSVVLEAFSAFESAARASGEVSARGSLPSEPIKISITPAGLPGGTSADDARALADARTIVPDGSTDPPPRMPGETLDPSAQSSHPPREASRKPLLAAIGAGVVAVAAGLFVLRGGGAEPSKREATMPASSAEASPSSAPSAHGPTVEPAHAAEVELKFVSTPEVVEVLQGDQRLGTSKAPIRVQRKARLHLTFKAEGYEPKELDVPATESGSVVVSLEKAAPGAASTSKPRAPEGGAKHAPAKPPSPPAKPLPLPAKPPSRQGGNPSEVEF
jgi:eukaryotic-like serine/threonine-protein kinase